MFANGKTENVLEFSLRVNIAYSNHLCLTNMRNISWICTILHMPLENNPILHVIRISTRELPPHMIKLGINSFYETHVHLPSPQLHVTLSTYYKGAPSHCIGPTPTPKKPRTWNSIAHHQHDCSCQETPHATCFKRVHEIHPNLQQHQHAPSSIPTLISSSSHPCWRSLSSGSNESRRKPRQASSCKILLILPSSCARSSSISCALKSLVYHDPRDDVKEDIGDVSLNELPQIHKESHVYVYSTHGNGPRWFKWQPHTSVHEHALYIVTCAFQISSVHLTFPQVKSMQK